jgi:hypothetical protein
MILWAGSGPAVRVGTAAPYQLHSTHAPAARVWHKCSYVVHASRVHSVGSQLA